MSVCYVLCAHAFSTVAGKRLTKVLAQCGTTAIRLAPKTELDHASCAGYL